MPSFATQRIAYEIRRRRGQKNLYLRIRSDGSVVVSAPATMSEAGIDAFVRQKEPWLRERLAHREAHARPEPVAYRTGLQLWLLGTAYPVVKVQAARNRVAFDGERFVFHCRKESGFAAALRSFYLLEAKAYILPRVEAWAQKMKLVPAGVAFRRYKSRWGCCDRHDRLVFNTALIRYDPELIDYVIVHELAHIRHKNHSKAFWALVVRYIPDYRHLRSRLV